MTLVAAVLTLHLSYIASFRLCRGIRKSPNSGALLILIYSSLVMRKGVDLPL